MVRKKETDAVQERQLRGILRQKRLPTAFGGRSCFDDYLFSNCLTMIIVQFDVELCRKCMKD